MSVTENYHFYRDAMIGHSQIPFEYLDIFTFTNVPEEDKETFAWLRRIYAGINDFVCNRHGNLYLYSEYVGNGKTRWACELAKKFMKVVNYNKSNDNTPVLFINVPAYLTKKKAAMTNPYVLSDDDKFTEANLTKAPLVIFDDIGDSDMTGYDYNELYSIIDTRLANGLSNIYTSNSSPSDLENRIPSKLADRILYANEYTYKYEFKGGSKRGLIF